VKSVQDTLQLILSHVTPLPAVAVVLEQCLNRVLRRDAKTDIDMPSFDRSAMDGYALAAPASEPSDFYTLSGMIAAGDEPHIALKPGQCTRIFTGAAIPEGTVRVLPQEDAEVSGDHVRPSKAFRAGNETFIRRRGEEARAGEILIPAGQILRPAHLGILAGIGITYPLVARKPRLMHVVSGNELIKPELRPGKGQIRDSNSTLLSSLCAENGAAVRQHIHAPDNEAKTLELISSFPNINYDVLLFSGGSGSGPFDFCRAVFEKLGFTLYLQGVDVRPGKPLLFATRGTQLAFGIPGNPLSHFVLFQLFIRPVLMALQKANPADRQMHGVIAADIPEHSGARPSYSPGRWYVGASGLEIEPLPWRSSGHLSSLSTANALLFIPANSSPHHKGETVTWLAF
jgi:molybdopterin molybdotransferase